MPRYSTLTGEEEAKRLARRGDRNSAKMIAKNERLLKKFLNNKGKPVQLTINL